MNTSKLSWLEKFSVGSIVVVSIVLFLHVGLFEGFPNRHLIAFRFDYLSYFRICM